MNVELKPEDRITPADYFVKRRLLQIELGALQDSLTADMRPEQIAASVRESRKQAIYFHRSRTVLHRAIQLTVTFVTVAL
jgi:hypothetical protein